MKKIINVTSKHGCVKGQDDVEIEATKEEMKEFEDALRVICTYRDAAMKHIKLTESQSDMTSYNYSVLRRDGKIIVHITTGMCG